MERGQSNRKMHLSKRFFFGSQIPIMTPQKKIQHLYWRAGFGLGSNQLAAVKNKPISELVRSMFKAAKNIQAIPPVSYSLPSPEDWERMEKEEKRLVKKELSNLVKNVNANWLRQMISPSSSPLLEKMTLFWHGHFACNPKRFDFASQQINTIKKYALGNFRDLLVAIAQDAAMLFYLNNQQNKKGKTNENFARELMELFTLGRGHYTEQDIQESARAFTGWSANLFTGNFEFKPKKHDADSKIFMGRTGNFDGEDIIDIILENKQTAVFITTKVYRYFVNEQLDSNHIKLLANLFYNSNYNIALLMQNIFESNWFYESKNIGNKIKSPIELLVGIAKVIELKSKKDKPLLSVQKLLGQTLLAPPNVAGWQGGKYWVNSATLLHRMHLIYLILEAAGQDTQPHKKNKKTPVEGVSIQLMSLKKVFPLSATFEEDFMAFLLQNSPSSKPLIFRKEEKKSLETALLAIMSLPEYQLC